MPIYTLKKSMYIYIVPATAPAIFRPIQTIFSGSLPSQDKWVGQEISLFLPHHYKTQLHKTNQQVYICVERTDAE